MDRSDAPGHPLDRLLGAADRALRSLFAPAHASRPAPGGDGAPGRTLVNGEEQPPKLTRQLHAGDVVRVETPGGGGHGARG